MFSPNPAVSQSLPFPKNRSKMHLLMQIFSLSPQPSFKLHFSYQENFNCLKARFENCIFMGFRHKLRAKGSSIFKVGLTSDLWGKYGITPLMASHRIEPIPIVFIPIVLVMELGRDFGNRTQYSERKQTLCTFQMREYHLFMVSHLNSGSFWLQP